MSNIQLSVNETEVLRAICENMIDCTNGDFGFADEINAYIKLDADIGRRQLPGICAALVKKGLYTSSDDKFRQTTLTAKGAAVAQALFNYGPDAFAVHG